MAAHIDRISLELLQAQEVKSLTSLKRYEDPSDALISCWVGCKYLYGLVEAFSDDSRARLEARQAARPLADALYQWLRQQRQRVPDSSATARAIDYTLKRWTALTRYLDNGEPRA